MKMNSYLMEMGVKIDFEVITTFPTKKVKGVMVEQTHLQPLSKKTTYFVTENRVKHTFDTIPEVMAFIPSTEVYQARQKLSMN